MTLETVDIPGIDILAAGGPYVGQGSKAGGDYYTVEDLQRFAAHAAELADEVRPGIKLGHSKEQQLLRESGLFDEHGQPAAGWLENLRVEGDKLYADAKRVPAKLAGLIKSGAFRTRSLEQRGNYTSQRTGKRYEWIVDGLALLGGKAPAVRTLDDIVALYSAADAELPQLDGEPPEDARTVNYEAASIPDPGMAEATFTLTSEQTGPLAKALGLKPEELAPEKLLAAIETATKTATQTVADQAKTELEAATKKLSDAEAKIKQLEKGDGKTSGDEVVEALKEQLKQLSADAEAGKGAAEELRVMRRDTLLDNAIRAGKLEPALRPQMAKLYDASPDLTRETIEALPKRDDLFKTYGADGAGITAREGAPDEEREAEDAMYKQYLAANGLETREATGAQA